MNLVVGGPFRRGLLQALLVLVLTAAACGGQSKADEGKDAAKAGEQAAEGEATTTTLPAGTSKKQSSSPANGGSTTTTTTAKGEAGSAASEKQADGKATEYKPRPMRTVEVTAELQESCVKPGGSQTVNVRTEPEAGVAYDTEYADYSTGSMPGHYGGNTAGYADGAGTWSSTWVVAPNAPAGKATVLVLVAKGTDGLGETKAVFTVADALGKCA